MALPLANKWTVTKSGNAAADVLPTKTSSSARTSWVDITDTDGNYLISSSPEHTWAIRYTSSGGCAICGEITDSEYDFVITIGGQGGQPGVHGIIYKRNIGDGQDPGTWEAEGEGGGEG